YRKPKNGAKLQHDNDDPTKCTLSQECFTLPDGVPFTAAETFKHVAFRKPTCGDCIINAVMNRCGPYGLDAFLPDSKRKFPAKPKTFFDKAHPGSSSAAGKQVPRLPLSKDWESVDFSLGAVANTELSVRDWVVRALHRYRFILGDTPSTFVQLDSFTGAKRKLASVDLWAHEPRRKPAIVCVNDDVQYSAPQVRQLFTGWMDKRWPEPARWEERAASRRRPAKQKQSSSSSS
ncbi:Xanthine phosphoribosyltransferase 1, partial [Tulasnella sp. 427]